MTQITIRTEHIALGQFLKYAGIAQTGGDARAMLEDEEVQVNSQTETRRGRKLYAGDTVVVRGEAFLLTRPDA